MNPYGASGRLLGAQRPAQIVHRPSLPLPSATQAPLFRVRGGPILVLQLVARLRSAASATVSTLQPRANPDSGLADVNLGAATAYTSLAVGNLLGLSANGAAAGALGVGGAIAGMTGPAIVDVGTIDAVTSAANTPDVEWFLVYQPLIPGATVTAVLSGNARGQETKVMPGPRWLRRRSAVVPQAAQAAIFRVTGGPVLIYALVGDTQTAFSATVTNLSALANPTSGLADVALAAATAVASLASGTLLVPSTLGAAFAAAGAGPGQIAPFVVDAGTIDLLTSANNPGAVEWSVCFEPLHPAGSVVIATA